MRVPFLPIVLILSFFWAMSNAAQARTTSDPIIDCDKNRTDPVTCTACNMYHESRGQPDPGLLAVALVTKNRVESPLYPNTFCEAVWQKQKWRVGARKNCWKEKRCGWSAQFSWTKDGKPDFVYNMDAWLKTLSYAKYVVDAYQNETNIADITFGAMWYHVAEIQEPEKVMRDEEHVLRWHIWRTTEHAPYWMGNYFQTVKIGDHTFYAKNEEAFMRVVHSMIPTFGVAQAEQAPEGAPASVTIVDDTGGYDVHTTAD